MKEQLVSLQTAKLAKEKDFGLVNYIMLPTYYDVDGNLVREPVAHIRRIPPKDGIHRVGALDMSKLEAFVSQGMDNSDTETLAPTQSLLQKWLRDEHDIYVDVHVNQYAWNGKVSFIKSVRTVKKQKNYYHSYRSKDVQTYEEALEEGLLLALNAIN